MGDSMNTKSNVNEAQLNELMGGVQTALAVIGGKWKLLILAQLVGGVRRYGELKRAIPEVSEKVLIQQLKELEADGMIQRIAYPVVPPKVEYSFTPYGKTICGVMDALYDWGTQHRETRG
jgi:DNA-binding HxlR family transcriptional regulator